jgi:hypothetical protein
MGTSLPWLAWLATIYGFFSIACASKSDGSLDPNQLMVRARRNQHLASLKRRFPQLRPYKVILLHDRDYRYRLIVPKPMWLDVISGMTEEQCWANFKGKVESQMPVDRPYVQALHRVWAMMMGIQR